MAKSPVKLRIDIVEDIRYQGAGIGKKYMVNKWVFERKTAALLTMALMEQVTPGKKL